VANPVLVFSPSFVRALVTLSGVTFCVVCFYINEYFRAYASGLCNHFVLVQGVA